MGMLLFNPCGVVLTLLIFSLDCIRSYSNLSPSGFIVNCNNEKNGTEGKSVINFLAIVNISVYYSVFKMLYL